MNPTRTILLAAAIAAAPAAAAFAQGASVRIRGTIERLDGDSLAVKTREGQDVTVALAPNLSVSAVVAKNLADIREGDYVASTSMRGPDGRLRALEVHYLPAGAGEGQFPYDLAPESVMTNALVSGVTAAPEGRVLRVTFKGTQAEIVVPPDAPVVAFAPADRSLLKPGAAIVTSAAKQADGKLLVSRATVEKDGVKPPM